MEIKVDSQILMSFADVPSETVERFREKFQQSRQLMTYYRCALQQDDVKLIRIKDYIKNPKDNGYRSLHLIVEIPIFLQNEKRPMKVEVQLRTIAMDFWASLEHRLRYKKDLDAELSTMLAAELKDCAETSARLDKRMEAVKNTIEKHKE